MRVTVRFAPSPTGLLHVGNARIALINWLFAKNQGGRFILRYDDTDAERSRADYAAAIAEDLRWLGLHWAAEDEIRQSDRRALYDEAIAKLIEAGRLYPCFETPEELTLKRKLQAAQHKPPVYDRAALALSPAERVRLEAEGRRPHFRFRLEEGVVAFSDLVRGPVAIDTRSLSDPVLVRADGVALYTLASVVDDLALGISHIIRGEDHVTNSVPQIQIFQALGGTAPAFAHLALLVGQGGEALSKRLGSLSLQSLRKDGTEPMAINSLLACLGTAKPIEPATTLDELGANFSFAAFGRAPARFDPLELAALSARVLHAMPYEDARPRLVQCGLEAADEGFWNTVRGNLACFEEVRDWWAVAHQEIAPVIEDEQLLKAAAALLPAEPWDGESWKRWTAALGERTGRKGKALFRPLRLALTGRPHGPDMHNLLPLIGRRRALARLRGERG